MIFNWKILINFNWTCSIAFNVNFELVSKINLVFWLTLSMDICELKKLCSLIVNPVNIYLFKSTKETTEKVVKTCSKLTIKTTEQHQTSF